MIGVVGGSGSGKTTVARAIYDFLGMDAAFIDQDAYYRDLLHLPLEERRRVNFDHPDAFDTELLVEQLTRLQHGHPIQKPTYDFAAHTRAQATIEKAAGFRSNATGATTSAAEPLKVYAVLLVSKPAKPGAWGASAPRTTPPALVPSKPPQ